MDRLYINNEPQQSDQTNWMRRSRIRDSIIIRLWFSRHTERPFVRRLTHSTQPLIYDPKLKWKRNDPIPTGGRCWNYVFASHNSHTSHRREPIPYDIFGNMKFSIFYNDRQCYYIVGTCRAIIDDFIAIIATSVFYVCLCAKNTCIYLINLISFFTFGRFGSNCSSFVIYVAI